MKDILVILGSHPGTRSEFDFDRTDCDVWVFNEAAQKDWVKRADAVFQIHAPVIWRNPANRNDAGHYEWLTSGNTPSIYMQEDYDEVPQARRYPREEIRDALLSNFNGGQEYYTSSPAYGVALGIYLGYDRIEIYGVEMETDTEYRFQRDGIAFWIGVAVGKGVDIHLHSKQLLQAPLYGYEGDIRLGYDYFTDRISELNVLAAEAQRKYEEHKATTNKLIADYAVEGVNPNATSKAVQEQVSYAYQFGLLDGARQENERYKKRADVMREASGGDFVFVRQEFEQAMQSLLIEKNKQVNVVNAYAVQLGQSFDQAEKAKNKIKRQVTMSEFTKIMETYITESLKLGIFFGAAHENKLHLDKLTELIRAAGGSKSEAVMLEALQCA